MSRGTPQKEVRDSFSNLSKALAISAIALGTVVAGSRVVVPVARRFFPAVRYRVSSDLMGKRFPFDAHETLVDYGWQSGVIHFISQLSQKSLFRNMPPISTQKIYAGVFHSVRLCFEYGAISLWMKQVAGERATRCGVFPVGTAAHRFLVSNAYTWRRAPSGELHISFAANAARMNAWAMADLKKAHTDHSPMPDVIGPTGRMLAYVGIWTHRKKNPVLFAFEATPGGRADMTVFASAHAYLSRPNQEWWQLTFPMVVGDRYTPHTGSILVRFDSVLGRKIFKSTDFSPTSISEVVFLHARAVRSIFARVAEDKDTTRRMILQDDLPLLTFHLEVASAPPNMSFVSSADIARWVLFKTEPMRTLPNLRTLA